jgi:ADP-ribose pyrophosphatase YjhB (NUDIX family)
VSGSRGQVVKAMAVIRRPRDEALLVSEAANPAGELFHRPLGGHVEFGEYAEHTVRRELLEEIGQSLSEVKLLGVLENIFDWAGSRVHEIVFVFGASFQDDSAYEIAEQRILDHAADDETLVRWRDADAASPPLYPDGLDDLIRTAPLAAKQPS